MVPFKVGTCIHVRIFIYTCMIVYDLYVHQSMNTSTVHTQMVAYLSLMLVAPLKTPYSWFVCQLSCRFRCTYAEMGVGTAME